MSTVIATILQELQARLRNICTDNGFNTNAGARVYLGRTVDPDRDVLPALTFVETPDGATVDPGIVDRPDSVGVDWFIAVDGFIKIIDNDNPLTELVGLAEDIVRAIYKPINSNIGASGLSVVPVKRWIFQPESWGKHGSVRWVFKISYTERQSYEQ